MTHHLRVLFTSSVIFPSVCPNQISFEELGTAKNWRTKSRTTWKSSLPLSPTAEYPYRGDLGVGKEKHAIGAESLRKQLLLFG